MKNDFRKRGILRVRVMSEEERERMYSLLRKLGFQDIPENVGQFYPRATNVHEIDIFSKTVRGVPSITACAGMASTGVRFYSVGELERLAALEFRTVPRFPIFHIPHDGWRFPEELVESVCIPEEQFLMFHEKMRDRDMNRIVPEQYRTGSNVARFEISRLLCDVERFLGPEEEMERYGMGFCYERVYNGTRIKNVTEELKIKTLKYYREHHDQVDRLCSRHSRILFFDLHSYSDEIVPKELARKMPETFPDVCIGTDAIYTPAELSRIVQERFGAAGFSVAENYPYIGCFVPDAVMRGESGCDCISIMIELNRRIYCDGRGETVPEKVTRIREILQQIMVDCVEL